ncbi:MAG: IPT/TIG domain-containing protein [Candidatus Kapabacteria bacterium]|nr:IPT/TIG domain-containing protein [Candidatus Kapabacteria bacterium]
MLLVLLLNVETMKMSAQTFQNTYIPDAPVNAITYNAGTVYVGGSFSQWYPSNAPMIGSRCVQLDAATGDALTPFPVVNGDVAAIVADGSGGWYIGGTFTSVGGVPRNNIAHILNTGALDMMWNPNANAGVQALALSGATVYAGGVFNNIGGQPRNLIAALDAVTGNATAWNPNADNFVRAIAVNGATVYVSGGFMNVGGQPRSRIAALDAATGNATAWNPNANSEVHVLAVNGTTVYAAGLFTNIGGQPRNRIVALDAATGLATAWDPNADQPVRALVVSGTTVYVAGTFTNIGGQPRNRIAALDAATGLATTWNPIADNFVNSLAVSGTTVYAGGVFANIGGQLRNRIAALDAATGNATAWTPHANGNVPVLAVNGTTICAGGSFTACGIPGRVIRNYIAALNEATGAPTAWNPNANGTVFTLTVNGANVYAGGAFTSIGGQPRSRIAALDAVTGNATAWNPNADNQVNSIAVDGTTVYAGGNFTNIGAAARNRLAALDAGTGLATAWNPNPNSQIVTVVVNGSTVYVGGFGMTAIGGSFRNNIAAVDAVSGLATAWDPNAGGTSVSGIALNGSTVYVGGSYSSLGGSTRTGLGAIDIATASLNPWDPNPVLPAGQLAIGGSTLYVGGAFTTISGQPRSRLAAYNTVTNTLEAAWTPSANNGISDIATGPSWVYVGGGFTAISGDATKQYFAAISLAAAAGGTYTWQGASGTGGAGDWQNAAHWSPSRTTPNPADVLQFNAGTHSPSNVPTQTISQLTIAAGARVSLRGAAAGQILTVSSNFTIPPTARLDLDFDGAPMNPVQLAMAASAVCTVNGTLNVSTASVTGTATSSFTLSAGGTLMTARDDGINGTAVGNGSVQGFALANITYTAGANYVLKTMPNFDVPMNTGNAGGTKPTIPTMNNLTIWGSTTFNNRARIFPPALTVNGACSINGRAVLSGGNALTLNGATTVNSVEFWIGGTVTLGAAATLTASGNYNNQTITLNGSGVITGGTPPSTTYTSDAYLVLNGSWAGTANDAFLPQTMGGNVSIWGGTTITLNNSKTIGGTLYVDGTLHCGTGGLAHSVAGTTTLDNSGLIILNGQSLTLGAVTNNGTGRFQGSVASNLSLNGVFTGNFAMQGGAQTLNNFTVNIGAGNAMTLAMGTSPDVGGLLTLTSGRVVTTPLNSLTVSNSNVAAIAGGGTNAYIDGRLMRRWDVGIATPGTHYFYPVGAGISYRPLTLRDVLTGAAPDVQVAGDAAGATSFSAPLVNGLPFNWRIDRLSGAVNSFTPLADATGVMNDYFLAQSTTQTGPYASLNGVSTGSPRLGTAIMLPPALLYLAFGLQGASITSFSPNVVNTGDTIVVVGTNFSGISAVGVGGVPSQFIVDSPTQIRVIAGAGANGVITLVTPAGVVASSMPVTFSNAPGVAAISPNFGTTGATVRITGTRLTGATRVSVGGTPVAAFVVDSPTQITATLGAGATGAVSVQTANGTGTLPNAFTFYRIPSVQDFTPKAARPGDTVRISGAEYIGVNRVSIAGRSITPFSVLSTSAIAVIVPAGLSGGRVSVRNLVGEDSSQAELTVINPPTITSVSPPTAAPNQVLTIFGTEFHPFPQVRIGGVTAANVTRISMTQIQCTFAVPVSGVLTVIASGGTVSTLTPVAIVLPPVVYGFQPPEPLQGEFVVVTGANFPAQGTIVFVGGVPIAATVNSSTRITLIIPPNLQGFITVRTPTGEATSATILRPIPPPVITSLAPQIGQSGSVVEIRGANFQDIRNVSIGGVSASFSVNVEGTLIRTIIPSFGQNTTFQAASEATVRVTTRGGTAASALIFTVLPPPGPILTGFSPMSLSEGEELRVFGANIPANARLFLNGIEVTGASIQAGGTVMFRVPAGIVPERMFSTNAVITLVSGVSPNQVSTNAALTLTLTGANLPSLTDFTPQRGGRETMITLTGQNLGTEPRGRIVSVQIGGAAVRSFSLLSSSTMTIVPGNVRTGRITVETSGGALSTTRVFEFDSTIVPIPPTAAQDSIALERLYDATGGTEWTTNATWRNRAPIAVRFGVRVENGRVVELRLAGNNLKGELDTAMFSPLTMLRALDMRNNQLSGELSAFSGAGNLRTLEVANNRLRGNLQVLCALRNIETLNVAQNLLTGTLPQCLIDKQSLTTLDASNNQLSGTLPVSFANTQNLKTLNLSGNRFTGAIPAQWGTGLLQAQGVAAKATSGLSAAATLELLNLSQNALSGAIPEALGTMRNLRDLRLNNNQLTGSIPASFAQLQRLLVLDLSVNELTNALPLQSLPRLDTLRLDSNRFTFGSLEPLIVVPTFSYQNQQLPRTVLPDTTVRFDFPVALRVSAEGMNNRYTWQRNGVTILRASMDAALRIAAFSASDTGEYVCTVTNTTLPDLSATVFVVRVRGALPMLAPQGRITLIAPFNEENEVPRTPALVWSSLAGANAYTVELSESATFSTVLFRRTIAQTNEFLTSGRAQFLTSTEQGFTLPTLQRIHWRVWASNSLGSGDTASGGFTTSAGSPVMALAVANFGKIPLRDSAGMTLELRNISQRMLRLRSVSVRVGGVASVQPSAVQPFVLRLPPQTTLQPNQATPLLLATAFIPQVLTEVRGDVVLTYTTNEDTSAVQTQIFPARLRGSGSALKIIPPRFDTLLVNVPRLSSALVVNLGQQPLRVNRLRLRSAVQPLPAGQSSETPYLLRSDEQNAVIASGDTLAILLEARTATKGMLAEDALLCNVQSEGATPMLFDTATGPLRSFGRDRLPSDAVMRVGVRAVPPEAPPGAAVRLEVFIAEGDLAKIRFTGTQSFRGTLRMSRQVLALAQSSSIFRVRTSTQKPDEQIITLPTTFWSGQNPLLLSVNAVVVAGSVDTTRLECFLDWGAETDVESVQITEFRAGRFQTRVSQAGGKRLISAVGAKLLAISPNPAQNLVEIRYMLPEAGFVTLTVNDIRGQEVRRIVSAVQSGGAHTQAYNLAGLPSGTYSLVLRVGDDVRETQQLQVVR